MAEKRLKWLQPIAAVRIRRPRLLTQNSASRKRVGSVLLPRAVGEVSPSRTVSREWPVFLSAARPA
jgi:hypothetical protein